MPEWPALIRRVALAARDAHPDIDVRLDSIEGAVYAVAVDARKAAGEDRRAVSRSVVTRWVSGDLMMPLDVWTALCWLARRGDVAAWHAEKQARRDRKAGGHVVTEEEIRRTRELRTADAARELGCSEQTVRAGRRRWLCES